MGVRGLSSFVKSQQCFDNKHRLHDCKIVIDANNLYHFIFSHHKIPYRCGGDYHLYVAKIKMYFETLESCNISPYLVYDGGFEIDNRKLKTSLDRARQRIHMSQSLARGGSGSVTPCLTSQTFLHVIKDIGIPCVVGDFEADSQIMLLSNQWNCPVLSNDSDFYIYDLTGGFITLDSVDYNPKLCTEESSGKKYKFLECQIYFSQNFVDLFPGLNKSLLPLFSTICGNDYICSKGMFDKFLCNIKKAPDNFGINIAYRKRNATFLSLLYWLHKQDSLEEAITNILSFSKTSERQQMSTQIKKSLKSYINIETSFDMKEYFETDTFVFKSSGLKKFFSKKYILPKWFIQKLKRCQLSSSFLNIIRLRETILMCQIEHMTSPSVYLCSAYIRQVIYGILLLDYVDKEPSDKLFINEYDRVHCNYEKKKITPIFDLPDFGPLPSLSDIPSATLDIKRHIMLLTLGSDLEFLKQFPEELKIVAATIVYWVKNANPKIHKAMVTALLVCNIYLWITIQMDKIGKSKVVLKPIGDGNTMSKLIEGTTHDTLKQIKKNLIKFCGNPSYDWKTKINTPVVHNFNQFQVTLRYVIQFNRLLQGSFYETSPYMIFSGTFLYNLFLQICDRANPQEFLSNLLIPGSEFDSLFISLDNAFHSVLLPCYTECTRRKKSKKNRKKKSENVNKSENDISDKSEDDDDINIDTENKFSILSKCE